MSTKKNSSPSVTRKVSGDRNISIRGDVVDSVVIAGDGNKVNIIQKFFNIFKTDAETVDQRNRRIMLGHVENFWVKGILEKSLRGAALLDLGIKEDANALNYPWTIKREANKETLPAGTSMLEIFQEIGMGRSLLILGAPGSGKTTMLLELTRQLIERAREDVTEPIPVVFNLSSWTEKLTLADWLAKELNNIYYVPRKIASTWVKENKMLLLLDGLDEVKQDSRDKCVDAINQFRKENGLTSMAVCSRIQDYAELKARLSFDGAVEIQLLTSDQVTEYFKRIGNSLAGIRQVLEKDVTLREMAETPLFLSIMTLAYRDTQSKDIMISEDLDIQRKHLFDTYIERMFERPERSKNEMFNKPDVMRWLSWLAQRMIEHNQVPYLLENMQTKWLSQKKKWRYRLINGLFGALIVGLLYGLIGGLIFRLMNALIIGLIYGLIAGLILKPSKIEMVDSLRWDWKQARKGLLAGFIFGPIAGFIFFLIFGLIAGLILGPDGELGSGGLIFGLQIGLLSGLFAGLPIGLLFGGLVGVLIKGISMKPISQATYTGQRILFSIRNFFIVLLLFELIIGLIGGLLGGWSDDRLIFDLGGGLGLGLLFGMGGGLKFGGGAVIQHYALRFIISFRNHLPWRLIPFLDYAVERIFLRRVGGGYIFVHRLLMEHFAAMYPEQT